MLEQVNILEFLATFPRNFSSKFCSFFLFHIKGLTSIIAGKFAKSVFVTGVLLKSVFST